MVGDGNEGNGGRGGGKLHLSLCLPAQGLKPKRQMANATQAEPQKSQASMGLIPCGSGARLLGTRAPRWCWCCATAGTARRSLPRAPVRSWTCWLPLIGALLARWPLRRWSAGVPGAPHPAARRASSAALLPACTLGVAALGLARYRLIVHPLRPGARPPPQPSAHGRVAAAGLLGALSLLGPPAPPPAPARCSVLAGASGPLAALGAAGQGCARPPAAAWRLRHLPRCGAPGRPAAPRPARGSRPRSDSLTVASPSCRPSPASPALGQSSPGSRRWPWASSQPAGCLTAVRAWRLLPSRSGRGGRHLIAYWPSRLTPSCTACCSALYAGRWALPGQALLRSREPALHGPGTRGPSCSTSRDLQRALPLALLRHLIKAGIWMRKGKPE